MNKKQKQFNSHAFLLHAIIKAQLNNIDFKILLKVLGTQLHSLTTYNSLYFKNITYKTLDEMAKTIIQADHNGETVYSCLSISILIHIYLCVAGIPSNIVIGSCILENKVYSHAWVRISKDNYLFDYRYDNYKYREIKRINLLEMK